MGGAQPLAQGGGWAQWGWGQAHILNLTFVLPSVLAGNTRAPLWGASGARGEDAGYSSAPNLCPAELSPQSCLSLHLQREASTYILR